MRAISPIATKKGLLAAIFALELCLSSAAFPQAPALGPTYPVIEPNFLLVLKEHAEDEKRTVTQRYREAQERFKNHFEHPVGHTLPEAATPTEHREALPSEVSARAPQDFYREWLFIDASRPQHLTLARRFYAHCPTPACRVIIVSGSLKDAGEVLARRVWFDQAGALSRRLKLTALPALVRLNREAITLNSAPPTLLLKDFSHE